MDTRLSSLGFLLLLMLQRSCYQTHALRHGSEPRWISDIFCTGVNELVKIPWNCGGYLQCTRSSTQMSSVWLECAQGLKFDETIPACVRYYVDCPDARSVSLRLCPKHKTLKFPHTASCAMYYDCSQTYVLGHFNLGMYENECPYPQLFDPDTGECRPDQPYPVICSNKPGSRSGYRKESGSTSPECVGKTDGVHPNPKSSVFSPEYVVCRRGSVVSSQQCNKELVFDPIRRQCSSDITGSINVYCKINPLAVFPDSLHCGRYYNCSSKSDFFFQSPNQHECLYMYLYDVTTSSCVMYDKLTVPCGTRFEPMNPCDYDVGQCIGRRFCLPCEAKCKGKEDGPQPYPTLPDTRFHLICKGNRTLEVMTCVEGEIYSHKDKLCISNVAVNPTPPPTTTESPVTTTIDSPVVTPADPSVCTCLDKINPLMSSLQNLSSFVNAMHFEMQVANPYDCDEPPLLPHSIMNVSYEFDIAVARYTCVDGYSACGGELKSTCSKDNIWHRSLLGECLRNIWTDTNNVTMPCKLNINSALIFRGRSVEDIFTFSLMNEGKGQTYLYVKVKPTTRRLEGGRNINILKTVTSPTPLTGETTWTIEFMSTSFEIRNTLNNFHQISVNGHHVISVTNPSPLSLIANFLLSDGFKAQEVKYLQNGIQALSGKHPLNVNLALNKPTTSSSTYEQAVPERAVDGYSNVLWGANSCWTASATDTQPWWMVDLGKRFYVSHVIISSLDCEGACGKSLMNFNIDVYRKDPNQNKNAVKEVCDMYGGRFPYRSIERVDCGSDVVGQFVMIATYGPFTDQMTLCEVEVYGGLTTGTGWSPFSCPDPPVIEGASVQLSYNQFEAMATYKCDGSDVMCTGNKVIRCSNETGWDAKPGSCIKTFMDAGIDGRLPDFPICRLNLGSGIELLVTPTENIGYVSLAHGKDTIFKIALTLQNTAKPVALSHTVSGVSSTLIYPPQNPFIKGKESHIIISALTDHLLIEVDGEMFYKYPVHQLNVHELTFVESTKDIRIRKAKLFLGFIFNVYREPVRVNLALNADKEASSSYANPESFAIDGNPSREWPTGSCWNANIGDPNQWYQVDLGKQYFIRDVIIDLRSLHGNDNLALSKQTFGSPNFNSLSSKDNVVDGNHNNIPLSGSCYTSSASVGDPWWMVDLGKTFTISSVAIQHRGDGNPDHHSDLSVIIYKTNPKTDANAQPSTCTQKTGLWGPFTKIPCNRPTQGRFILVKRIEGANKGPMTICEVQVFEALESKLHDFTVNVYEENPVTNKDTRVQRFIKHRGDFPKYVTTLTCAEDVWGRYVRIKADDIRDEFDQMTICEMEVYGDKVVKKEWSPTDCPKPPLHQNAFVSVALTPIKAIARYECFEGFDTCSGRDTITCESEEGWIDSPESCLPRTFSAYDPSGLEIIHFCPLRLGEVIEIYIKPNVVNSVLVLAARTNEIFDMKWMKAPRREVVINTDLTGAEPYPPVLVEPVPFEIDKESRVVITLLSQALHVDIDGKTFYIKVKSSYLIDTVWTRNATMGKLSIIKAGVNETMFLPSLDNLAASRPTSASSVYGGVAQSGRAVDGNLAMSLNSNSCWLTSANNMEDAWWLVKLDNLYYVSAVKITTRADCGADCNRRVHDFIIETFHRDPEPKDTGDLCLKFDGVLPHATTITLTCIEKVFGRVLRISAPDRRNMDDLFTLCEVQVFGGLVIKAGEDPRNLALFRPALSSSKYGGVALAGRAVDGNKNIKYISGSCWMAAVGDSDPWWQVELDNYYFISHVEITSRIDCGPTCESAFRDFVIEVSPQNPSFGLQTQLCLKYDGVFPDSTTRTLKCTNKALGRFVKISTSVNYVASLCEVEVYGEEVTFEEATSANLAVNRPVSASSRLSPPQWAADGNKNMNFSGDSCWSAEDGDTTSWWMVELDDYYLVSEVGITSRNDCGTECNKRLRNFKIELFNERPEPGDIGDVCLVYPDVFPHSNTDILQCTEKTLGRFVRLTAKDRRPSGDELTICEFEVFGAQVIRTGWTPSNCPEPPLLPNACVDVCYNADHAVATYTCNSNYSMCTGNNVLYCNSKAGWEGTPGNCVQTTLEVHHGHVTDLSEFPICYPRLGEGIEMWVTPEEFGCTLELLTDHEGDLAIYITINADNVTVGGNAQPLKSQFAVNNHFILKKESHVVFLFLTSILLVKVDGKLLALNPDIPTSANIYYVRSSDGLRIRMARPVDRYMKGIVRVQRAGNLAKDATISVSSTMSNHSASTMIDGYLSQSLDSGECWTPDKGDKNQWVMIDLGDYYFITELILHNRAAENCTSCEKRTRDFVITVHSSISEDDVSTCAVYKGVLPLEAVETVRCKEDVWGRYVRISTAKELKNDLDLMTFCEIEIYGDEVIQKPWTIFDCPKPILHTDSSVQISYYPDRTVATYTCRNDYSMCTGSNVLTCNSHNGWEGFLGTCQRTRLERPYGRANDLNKFPICKPKLGEGIELWLFPTTTNCTVSLLQGERGRTSLALIISPDQASQRVRLVTEIDGVSGNEVLVTKDLFSLEMEAHVVIIFLTYKLLIIVDGKFLATFPHHFATPEISFINSTSDVNIRMFRPLPRYLNGIVRTPLDNNLALNKITSASSVHSLTNNKNIVDGNNTQSPGASCFHPDVGDRNQWVMIDLGDYYFIRELIMFTRSGSGCNSECAKRTHDFAIDILPNDKVDELTTRCAFYEGIMPAGAVEKIRCKEDAWGRYVRISATNVKTSQDLMTFCEVQVYGDAVIDEKYQKCPRPVQVDNGEVTFTGLFPNDVATLTCNANSKPCGSQLTARCQETAEWEKLTTCYRFLWESPEVPFLEALPCVDFYLATYTIKATPTAGNRSSINLLKGDDILFHVSNRLNSFGSKNATIFNSRISGTWGTQEETPTYFTVGQEIVIQIRFSTLAGSYEYILDGTPTYTFSEKVNGTLPDSLEIKHSLKLGLVEVLYEI